MLHLYATRIADKKGNLVLNKYPNFAQKAHNKTSLSFSHNQNTKPVIICTLLTTNLFLTGVNLKKNSITTTCLGRGRISFWFTQIKILCNSCTCIYNINSMREIDSHVWMLRESLQESILGFSPYFQPCLARPLIILLWQW